MAGFHSIDIKIEIEEADNEIFNGIMSNRNMGIQNNMMSDDIQHVVVEADPLSVAYNDVDVPNAMDQSHYMNADKDNGALTNDETQNKIDNKNEMKVKIPRHDKNYINTDIFEIITLTSEEQINEIELRKTSLNYIKANYKCTLCYKGFVDIVAYNGHVAKHAEQYGEYLCEVCKIRFKAKATLTYHQSSHKQKFICKKCPFLSTLRAAAHMHAEYHYGKRYTCEECGEVYEKVTTYLNHTRIKHPSGAICDMCGYSFASEKGLARHKKLRHRTEEHTIPEDGPTCEECNITFISKDALENHMSLWPKHKDDGDEKPRKRNDVQVKAVKKRKPIPPPVTREQRKRKVKQRRSKHNDVKN